MENFAVDLDKVLDEFELGEDENEGTSSYDKLQLEFNDRSTPNNSDSPGPLPDSKWRKDLCEPPPGNRSPPDGQQNDPEADPLEKSESKNNSSFRSSPCKNQNTSSFHEETCKQSQSIPCNDNAENTLWPHLLNSSIIESKNFLEESVNQQDLPGVGQINQNVNGPAAPLDILPPRPESVDAPTAAAEPEIQHPDLIDINNQPQPLNARDRAQSPPRNDDPETNGESNNDLCLLPDLTFSNRIRQGSPDMHNPDVVTVNIAHSDEPALVQESQCLNRIPEVANIHQSAELGTVKLPSMVETIPCSQHSVPVHDSDNVRPPDRPDISIILSNCVDASSRSSALPDVSADCEESQLKHQLNSEPSNPTLVRFDPNTDVNDEELQAELAELERLQEMEAASSTRSSQNVMSLENQLEAKTMANGEAGEFQNTDKSCPSHSEDQNYAERPPTDEFAATFDEPSQCTMDALPPDTEQEHLSVDRSDETSTGSSDTTSSSSTLVETNVEDPQLDPIDMPSSFDPRIAGLTVNEEDSASGREEGAVGISLPPEQFYDEESVPSSVVGVVAPFWIPDVDAANCQECNMKFTLIRRRHHCRACGRVLCANCCHEKAPLPYMNYREARVCAKCLSLLTEAADHDDQQYGDDSQNARSPNPNNPMEYCSRIPPTQQAVATVSPLPTVMVPAGILKRENSGGNPPNPRTRGNKQVIFMDGIQPGGDLSECSPPASSPYRKSNRSPRRPQSLPGVGGKGRFNLRGRNPVLRGLPSDECLIPTNGGLPPVLVEAKRPGEYLFDKSQNSADLNRRMQGEGPPVAFGILRNLTVLVKRIKLDCCIGLEVWNLATRGLCTVGQEELVVLLQVEPGESSPPPQIFTFFHTVYQQANKGNLVTELGHTIFTEPEGFLGSKDHVGFLYVRPSFQCMTNLVLPPAPFIFAVLILKWETPWAKVFPMRLMLRLGAEFRYYPCPLVSCRNRKPVFGEIGNTIMNILVDFRNYTYTIPLVQGLVVHMEEKLTTVLIPKNRYEQVWKALDNSNDHVLALSANFSPQADSHLVTVEDDDGNYSTQAINIQNRPRKMTGASFIVFNGALNSSSGLKAKSSIVEDGMMVQIPGDTMSNLRDALRNLKDFDVPCGPSMTTKPDQMVLIRWSHDDKNFNIGIKSSVDGRPMDGVPSLKIHAGTDYVSSGYVIRWTELYIIQGETVNGNGDVNISRLSESLSRACCVALTSYLKELYAKGQTKLALRATVHQENVEYDVGSGGNKLPPACHSELDTELIPVIHQAAANVTDQPIILELLFHVLRQ